MPHHLDHRATDRTCPQAPTEFSSMYYASSGGFLHGCSSCLYILKEGRKRKNNPTGHILCWRVCAFSRCGGARPSVPLGYTLHLRRAHVLGESNAYATCGVGALCASAGAESGVAVGPMRRLHTLVHKPYSLRPISFLLRFSHTLSF